MISRFNTIQEVLGYHFSNISLLKLALTHSSVSKANNERLEFLGDALVNLIIGDYLFKHFPEAQEGRLSRIRASLVKGEALATLANLLGLSEVISVGPGEILIEGKYRASILAGAMEALIGAVYLDSDFLSTQACVLRWYEKQLLNISLDQQHIDAKTQLQELLQARRVALPVYSVLSQEGLLHRQVFHVECRVADLNLSTQADGHNRKCAEQIAAALMIEKVNHV